MLDLILFPPGARGDFLGSILFGDQLLTDGKSPMITDIGTSKQKIVKVHNLPEQSWWADVFVTDSDLSKYRTFIIDVSDPIDQQNVAWLVWRKKPRPVKPGQILIHTPILKQEWFMPDGTVLYYDGTATYHQDGSFNNLDDPSRFGAIPGANISNIPPIDYTQYTHQELMNFLEACTDNVKNWNSEYCKYYQQFDHVVPFKKLFELEYISELYKKIHNTELPPDALERIQHNIKINNDIIEQNLLLRDQYDRT
jgi:hypothetical protein